jgi:hypothetical protein
MIYIFFRKKDVWYPVDLRSDADVPENVRLNPGTLRVEDANGRIVWPEAQPNDPHITGKRK